MIYDLQRASMWKRVSAWLLDAILLCIVTTLMALLLSTALNYDDYSQRLDAQSPQSYFASRLPAPSHQISSIFPYCVRISSS